MDAAFELYRYLVHNRHRTDDNTPYNVAYRAFESYLEIDRDLSYFAGLAHAHGGFEFEQAEKLTERLITSFEAGLSDHHGSALLAAISFVQKYIGLDDIDMLIDACHEEKKRMEREEDAEDEAREEAERLAFLESGEAIEDQ